MSQPREDVEFKSGDKVIPTSKFHLFKGQVITLKYKMS